MKIEEIMKSSNMSLGKQAMFNLMYTSNLISEKVQEVMKGYDLSQEQFNVLRILRGQKGKPANMHIIQERMIAKTSNTTRLVDKLLLKDLVSRSVCPGNRRKMEVKITQKGLDLLSELDPVVEASEQAFTQNLDDNEIQQLIALLEKYRTV
ncbi:MarR family winged helix-turn-helix transcriptional regulator [Flavobacterium sp. RHBU_24]|uniref:MarR family winged helix-turn-helix transcriptional regulator n=1 Tax=Flavobacterium sp. RHBU_24 TaxID=3391185 RepID=UPI003984BFAE